jgi:transcriptional regulator with XRE-family HTH domain
MIKKGETMEILTLGEKIKSKRKEMNMTLKELAGDRITPGQISLVESGKSKPSIDLLEYISDKLNTDIEYFLESEEKQATLICKFYINIAESAISAGNTLRAEEYIEKGMQYAKKYNLLYLKGRFDIAYSTLEYVKGNYETSQQYCISANSVFLKTNNLEDSVRSFILQGLITMKMGYTYIALSYFQQGDNMLNESNHVNEQLKAKIFFYIALCNHKLGNHQKAVEYAAMASERIKILNDRKKYAETLMILGIAYSQENKIEDALKYATEANKRFNEIDDVVQMADMELDLGVIFADGNNMDESFAHLDEALRIKKGLTDEHDIEVLFNICENYININDLDNAEKVVEEIENCLEDEQYEYKLRYYKCQYRLNLKKKMIDKAENMLLEAESLAESLGYKKELGDVYTMMGQFYTSANDNQKALIYIKKGINIYAEIGEIPLPNEAI